MSSRLGCTDDGLCLLLSLRYPLLTSALTLACLPATAAQMKGYAKATLPSPYCWNIGMSASKYAKAMPLYPSPYQCFNVGMSAGKYAQAMLLYPPPYQCFDVGMSSCYGCTDDGRVAIGIHFIRRSASFQEQLQTIRRGTHSRVVQKSLSPAEDKESHISSSKAASNNAETDLQLRSAERALSV